MSSSYRTHKGDYNKDGSRAVKPAPPVTETVEDVIVIEEEEVLVVPAFRTPAVEEKVKPKPRRGRRK
jgi:hypothetical protein